MHTIKRLVALFFTAGLFLATGCKSYRNSFDNKLLYGKWIPTSPHQGWKILIIDNHSFNTLLMDSTEEDTATPDTMGFRYTLKSNLLTLHFTSVWETKFKLLKLNKDSLVYRRVKDRQLFSYERLK